MAKDGKTCIILFLENNGVYNAGEKASFNMTFAAKLVKTGKAELVDDNVTKAELGVAAAEDAAEETGLDTRTHEMSIGGVENLVEEIEEVDELVELSEGERNHPKHDGGRKGVHAAIKARIAELEAE